MSEQPQPGQDFVQSLARGLSVLKAFDAEHARLTLSDVARATGLTRAATRRFLLTLVELGYIRVEERYFSLRPRVLELGYAFLSALGLPEVAQPHLEQLSAAASESASVAVLDADEVVYVARVPMKRIMTVGITVGTRFPAYATSLGRVLLAGQSADWLDGYLATLRPRALTRFTITDTAELRDELARVREQGWALADQQLEEGLRSLAAPVRDADGGVVAGVNVSVHTSRGSSRSIRDELLPILKAAASAIEEDLRTVTQKGAPPPR